MIINGTIVDIKTYETKHGKVVNLYVKEDPLTSVIFHSAVWNEEAEEIENKLQVSDTITMRGYASAIEPNQKMITISGFKLVEVKRSVVTDQIVLCDDQRADTLKRGDAHD